eukprot:CAMPEP_0194355876 /NCGR_PEP_ID=MMETSP0174-20130528/3727_1 /TAXON_ID=216777 /ORGANISM="Proboscia alata, Strain PI-D3" /LENGTH=137 /DNA_ID=CAMNT_0039125329 /DNA_START=171 /DNA_END=584 /DNA_ORIENTATION=-
MNVQQDGVQKTINFFEEEGSSAKKIIKCPDPKSLNNSRKPRILLGICGSVAAVKGPELAVKLSGIYGAADVRVLLTRGGVNFWGKTQEYDAKSWQKVNDIITKSAPFSDLFGKNHSTDDVIEQTEEDAGRIFIHGEI